MRWLPHHHEWPLVHEGGYGLQVHWFGQFAGYPDWHIERSRLTAHMVAISFVKASTCWCELNGTRHDLKAGDLLIIRGADEFEFGHDPKHPAISLSASLAVSQGSGPNILLQQSMPLASLFDEPAANKPRKSPVALRDEQPVWKDPASGYVRRNVSPPGVPQPLHIVEVLFPAGRRVAFESTVRDTHLHQQVWMLEGTMEITVGGECHRLRAGDCLAIEHDRPKMFHNPTRKRARYAVAIASENSAKR